VLANRHQLFEIGWLRRNGFSGIGFRFPGFGKKPLVISRWQRDHQQTPFLLSAPIEKPMPLLTGDKGKFSSTQLQMLVLNLEVKRSFEDEKGLVVRVAVKWNTLLWRNSGLKEGKGVAGIGCDRQKGHDAAGKLEGLSLAGSDRLHASFFLSLDTALAFVDDN
jgi:hypothetical protein